MSNTSEAAARLGEIVAVCDANNCDKFIPLFVVTGGPDQGATIQMELRVDDLRAVLAELAEHRGKS